MCVATLATSGRAVNGQTYPLNGGWPRVGQTYPLNGGWPRVGQTYPLNGDWLRVGPKTDSSP